MKILYIRRKNFTQFLLNNYLDAKKTDIIIFAPDCIPFINIDNELEGLSNDLTSLCYLSKTIGVTIIVFCKVLLSKELDKVTNAGLVISEGKLLGICEEIDIYDTSKVTSINVYEIDNHRICVLVGNNSKVAEFIQLALDYKCDIIINGIDNSSVTNTNLARYFLQEFNLASIIASKNKVEVFGKKKQVENKKNASVIYLNKLGSKRMPTYFKYLHKSIYSNFNEN